MVRNKWFVVGVIGNRLSIIASRSVYIKTCIIDLMICEISGIYDAGCSLLRGDCISLLVTLRSSSVRAAVRMAPPLLTGLAVPHFLVPLALGALPFPRAVRRTAAFTPHRWTFAPRWGRVGPTSGAPWVVHALTISKLPQRTQPYAVGTLGSRWGVFDVVKAATTWVSPRHVGSPNPSCANVNLCTFSDARRMSSSAFTSIPTATSMRDMHDKHVPTNGLFANASLVDVCPPLGEGWPNVGRALGLYIR